MNKQQTNYDSPWKQIIEDYFPQFLEFFFPTVYNGIDWQRPVEFLDQELQQLLPQSESGQRRVDKVAKVWLLEGTPAWILLHLEVQSQYESQFPKRMFIYHYRLFDRHEQPVISLAVLADEEPNWRPSGYRYDRMGCSIEFAFPTVKLLDYENQWSMLEQSSNPFAVVVMAHLKTKATHRDPDGRLHWKLSLVKGLYERGYGREDVIRLFKFIDWLMVLPPALTQAFKTEVRQYEEAKKVQYVTSIERLAITEGIGQGVLQNAQENTIEALEIRFGAVPTSIVEAIEEIQDPAKLKTLHRQAIVTHSLAEFQAVLNDMVN